MTGSRVFLNKKKNSAEVKYIMQKVKLPVCSWDRHSAEMVDLIKKFTFRIALYFSHWFETNSCYVIMRRQNISTVNPK